MTLRQHKFQLNCKLEQLKFFKQLLVFYLVFSFNNAYAQDQIEKLPWIECSGYLKDLESFSFSDGITTSYSSNLIHNRLNFKFNFSEQLIAKLELRNRIVWGNQLKLIPDYGKYINAYDGYFNLSKLWINQSSFVMHSVVDRLYFQFTPEHWDLRIGRQRINWGLNTIWNPNDIFNAYNFLDFDYEERPGNDAIRIQRFLNEQSKLEFAYKPGKNKHAHIGAFLYKFNKWTYDIQVLAGLHQDDLVVGGGWAGNLLNAGFKCELSYFHPKEDISNHKGVWTASFVLDQTFKNDWYVSFSSLFNSKPSGLQSGGLGFFDSQLSAKSLFPFKFSFYSAVSKSFTPIFRSSLALIYSPSYNSLITVPTIGWNALTNIDLDLTIQAAFADTGSGYQTAGNLFVLRGKWSF